MDNKNLNVKEIKQLLAEYQSTKNKLLYQLNNVEQVISELEMNLRRQGNAIENRSSNTTNDYIPTIPRKLEEKLARSKAIPRYAHNHNSSDDIPQRRKYSTRKGYKLSKWDAFVLETIRDANKFFTKADLDKALSEYTKNEGNEMSDKEVYIKVSRVLTKLTNRRRDLGAYKVEGMKGYFYGLKEWFDDMGYPKNEYMAMINERMRMS